jgi:superfamily II DNA or RNA helicase
MLYKLLYDYQKKIVDDLSRYDSCGLFMDVGTGKSITSLALFEQKTLQKKCNKLVIVCLCAKLEEWKEDCEKWFPFNKVLLMDGKKKNRELFRSKKFDIAIINFEKTWRNDDLLFIDSNTMIIIDESHKIKSSETKIGKFMQSWSYITPYKCILTATPMGNGYIDLYNQLYFLGLINMTLKVFKESYCFEKLLYIPGMKPFKQITGYHNTEELELLVNKYARYYERKLDDDLVPSESMIPIKLDEKYYKISKDRVYKDIALDKIGMKRVALKSLCSGTLIGNDLLGNKLEYQLDSYKLDWVKSFLEDFKERVVIFYMYDHQRDQLYDMITNKLKRSCARYCSVYKEKEIFENNDDAVVLVQYKSGSTGVDWLKKSYIGIFYSLPDSYIEFYQAKGRLNRVGQTKKPLYYLLVSKGKYSVDYMNYEALMNKQDFNDEFFAEKMQSVEEVM